MERRPNILLIMADQLAPQFLPPYGHRVVQAPHLDRLANEGVVFDAAYTNSPLCGPSRAAMMTGRLGSSTGVYDNAAEWPASIPTFAHGLRDAGYRTCLAGKMHFVGPDQLHGFEERVTTDIYPADFGWTPSWDDPENRFEWWFHNMDAVTNAGVAEATNQLDYDDEVGHQAVRKLRDLARIDDERPWMLTASFTHPHDPYAVRQEYWDRYNHDDIDLPTVGPISGEQTDPHSRRLRHVSDMDSADITDDDVRNARHAYYAAVSYIDDWVGKLMETLDGFGMADDTVVIFTADHGDMLGERGLWYKMTFFEHSARIPLIVWAPGRIEPRRVSEPVSLLDMAPTLAGFSNSSSADDLEGSSLEPLINGEAEPDRVVYGEYLGEGTVAPLLMVRKGSHKYVWCSEDPPQLFDLSADADELVNLADDPHSAAKLEELHALLERRWDPVAIQGAVLESQRRRRLVDRSLRKGTFVPWEYEPPSGASDSYMRNHLDLNDLESRRRFPR